MAPSPRPTGKGYWLVGADGGVFTYGDAGYFGLGPGPDSVKLSAPIVGVAATADRKGYWLVGADGGVFAFGDAGYFGSLAAAPRQAGGAHRGHRPHPRRQGLLARRRRRRRVRLR